jgi:hypothetical protein
MLELQRELGQLGKNDGAKRIDLSQQLLAAHEDLVKAEQKKLSIIEQQSKVTQERLRSELEAAKEGARSERDRLDNAKAQFGLLNPLKRQAVNDVSMKLKMGLPLSDEELAIAGSSSLLQQPLHAFGLAQANQDPLAQSIIARHGLDVKAINFEKEIVRIDQEMKAEIKLSEESLARQLSEQLVPKIHEMMQQVQRIATEKIQQHLMGQTMNEANMFPRGG